MCADLYTLLHMTSVCANNSTLAHQPAFRGCYHKLVWGGDYAEIKFKLRVTAMIREYVLVCVEVPDIVWAVTMILLENEKRIQISKVARFYMSITGTYQTVYSY